MEQKLEKLSDNVDDMKKLISMFNHTLLNIENRLARLEKMDSIEHRVEVNQIDLSDIKEALERLEEIHVKDTTKLLAELMDYKAKENGSDLEYLHRRLDSQLIKLAKAEEEIQLLKTKLQ